MSSQLVKYPRTPHLPWSPGGTKDDSFLIDVSHFEGREVVVTEKMDGENTSLYQDHYHARSLDGRHHPSRDWVKAFHAGIASEIPEGWRLCGENLYAQHSIIYDDLRSYFYLFSVWNDQNVALSWDDTLEWVDLLGVDVVPELYRGEFDRHAIEALELDLERQEGYVVRVTDAFAFKDFADSVAKWVRPHHVQTDQHWMYAEIVPNRLAQRKEKE